MEVDVEKQFERKKGVLKFLIENVVAGVIVEQAMTDPDIIKARKLTCWNCPSMDKANIACNECGCFLDVKIKSLVNIVPNSLPIRSEITHCPLNKWEDKFSKSFFNTQPK